MGCIQGSAEMGDARARLDLALLGVKSRIATQLLPIYQALVDAMRDVAAWFAKHEQATALLQIGLIAITGALLILGAAIAAIVLPVLLLLFVIMGPVILSFSVMILVAEDLYQAFTGGNSVIRTFIEAILALAGISLQNVRDEVQDLQDSLRETYNAIAVPLGLDPIRASHGAAPLRSNAPKVEAVEATLPTKVASEGPSFLARIRASTNSSLRPAGEVQRFQRYRPCGVLLV